MGLHILVLAGGSGTRLWPLSRAAIPKHLLPIGRAGTTLLRTTVERVLPLGGDVHVVTAAQQADACRDDLDGLDLPSDAIIAEPCPRGTGPALGLAVRTVMRNDPEAIFVSVHADHHIGDDNGYRAALTAAAGWAHVTGGLVTIGLHPTYAATGFGYVELGEALSSADWRPPSGVTAAPLVAAAGALQASRSLGFVEKPAQAVAEQYLAGGRHRWNSGLFAWPGPVFERELSASAPTLGDAIADVVRARSAHDDAKAAAIYERITAQSVDTLVFERTQSLTIVEAAFPWSDLGSWADLRTARQGLGESDNAGNIVEGDAVTLGSSGCLVSARGGRLLAVVGAEDLVVVDTGDVVLVIPADRSQAVREVVDTLRAGDRSALL